MLPFQSDPNLCETNSIKTKSNLRYHPFLTQHIQGRKLILSKSHTKKMRKMKYKYLITYTIIKSYLESYIITIQSWYTCNFFGFFVVHAYSHLNSSPEIVPTITWKWVIFILGNFDDIFSLSKILYKGCSFFLRWEVL